jgi:hypothetical protein
MIYLRFTEPILLRFYLKSFLERARKKVYMHFYNFFTHSQHQTTNGKPEALTF